MLNGAGPPPTPSIPARKSAMITRVAIAPPFTLVAALAEAAEGIDVEVIDPRTLQPLDTATIVESVRKTNRVIVVHEAVRFGGLGAEIAAQIQEEAFDYLDAPVGRIAAPFSPVPFTPTLEQAYLPSAADIEAKIRAIIARPGT